MKIKKTTTRRKWEEVTVLIKELVSDRNTKK